MGEQQTAQTAENLCLTPSWAPTTSLSNTPGLRHQHSTAGLLITILASGLEIVGVGDALLIAANESHKCEAKGAGDVVF